MLLLGPIMRVGKKTKNLSSMYIFMAQIAYILIDMDEIGLTPVSNKPADSFTKFVKTKTLDHTINRLENTKFVE